MKIVKYWHLRLHSRNKSHCVFIHVGTLIGTSKKSYLFDPPVNSLFCNCNRLVLACHSIYQEIIGTKWWRAFRFLMIFLLIWAILLQFWWAKLFTSTGVVHAQNHLYSKCSIGFTQVKLFLDLFPLHFIEVWNVLIYHHLEDIHIEMISKCNDITNVPCSDSRIVCRWRERDHASSNYLANALHSCQIWTCVYDARYIADGKNDTNFSNANANAVW